MTHQREVLYYSGTDVPIGGLPGDVLVKLQNANYYCAWRTLESVFEHYDIVLDDGEY